MLFMDATDCKEKGEQKKVVTAETTGVGASLFYTQVMSLVFAMFCTGDWRTLLAHSRKGACKLTEPQVS